MANRKHQGGIDNIEIDVYPDGLAAHGISNTSGSIRCFRRNPIHAGAREIFDLARIEGSAANQRHAFAGERGGGKPGERFSEQTTHMCKAHPTQIARRARLRGVEIRVGVEECERERLKSFDRRGQAAGDQSAFTAEYQWKLASRQRLLDDLV